MLSHRDGSASTAVILSRYQPVNPASSCPPPTGTAGSRYDHDGPHASGPSRGGLPSWHRTFIEGRGIWPQQGPSGPDREVPVATSRSPQPTKRPVLAPDQPSPKTKPPSTPNLKPAQFQQLLKPHWATGPLAPPTVTRLGPSQTRKRKWCPVSFIEACFLCQGTRWDSIYPPAISNLRFVVDFRGCRINADHDGTARLA